MLKNLLTLLFVSVLALPLATTVFAQAAPAPAKETRWEGNIIRSDTEKSTITVRGVNTEEVKTVEYTSSTKWVSQEHGSNKVNDIDASQVKTGDFVICKGTWENKVFHATVISKRLSHTPQ